MLQQALWCYALGVLSGGGLFLLIFWQPPEDPDAHG